MVTVNFTGDQNSKLYRARWFAADLGNLYYLHTRKNEVRISRKSKLNLTWIFLNIQLSPSLFLGFSWNNLLFVAGFGNNSRL